MGPQRLLLLSANSPQSLAGTAARPADWHEGGERGRHSTTWRTRSPCGGGVKIRSWFPGEQRQ
jgi:hypothetical protein